MTASVSTRLIAVLLGALLAAACSGDSPQRSARAATPSGNTAKQAAHKIGDSAAGNVDLGSVKYRTNASLGATGSLRGTIKLEAPSRADSNMTSRVCGSRPALPARDKAGALVWIADITSGKALPMEKRAELSSDDCLVFPPVQAAIVGTTFNVFNDDKTLHKFVFTRAGTNDTLAVMPFFNEGQVVASEKLAKTSGIVDIRCVQHPWTHGYIAVFDHPYFAVTDPSGKFTIDSIPPGTYTVMVWQDGMEKAQPHRVQIAAGGAAALDLSGGPVTSGEAAQVSSTRSTTIAAKRRAR